MTRAALVLAAVAALAALPASHALAATEQRCGAASSALTAAQDVRAIEVSCVQARRFARRFTARNGRNEVCDLAKRSCVLDRYTCHSSFLGNSGTRVRCAKGTKKIRFFYGA